MVGLPALEFVEVWPRFWATTSLSDPHESEPVFSSQDLSGPTRLFYNSRVVATIFVITVVLSTRDPSKACNYGFGIVPGITADWRLGTSSPTDVNLRPCLLGAFRGCEPRVLPNRYVSQLNTKLSKPVWIGGEDIFVHDIPPQEQVHLIVPGVGKRISGDGRRNGRIRLWTDYGKESSWRKVKWVSFRQNAADRRTILHTDHRSSGGSPAVVPAYVDFECVPLCWSSRSAGDTIVQCIALGHSNEAQESSFGSPCGLAGSFSNFIKPVTEYGEHASKNGRPSGGAARAEKETPHSLKHLGSCSPLLWQSWHAVKTRFSPVLVSGQYCGPFWTQKVDLSFLFSRTCSI